ncbi:MAG: hypothetical protein J7484_14200 [Microbacterium sp.]|nr:hypothetical protein [Microbacterium sp.]
MFDPAFTPLVVPRLGAAPVDARDEAERARTRGYADGFAEGRRLASAEAARLAVAEQERMRVLREEDLHRRGSALAALHDARNALQDRVEQLSALSIDRIEELAIDLASSILGAELSDPARSAAHALRRAADELPLDRWVRVSFDENDLATLLADAETAGLLQGIEVVPAAGVGAGGAIVEIEDGAVDTRIAEAVARADAALHGDADADGEVLP